MENNIEHFMCVNSKVRHQEKELKFVLKQSYDNSL